jgi:hypothetical protein
MTHPDKLTGFVCSNGHKWKQYEPPTHDGNWFKFIKCPKCKETPLFPKKMSLKTDDTPTPIESAITIGKYILYKCVGHKDVFIEIDGDGEGGGFNESELEKVIGEFYDRNF